MSEPPDSKAALSEPNPPPKKESLRPSTFDDMLKASAVIGAVLSFLWGVWVWRDDSATALRQHEAENRRTLESRRVEALRPFLEHQLKLYTEATATASKIASATDLKQRGASEQRFWELYWGELPLVENPGVETAMRELGDSLARSAPREELQQRSLKLAHECRRSLDRSWGIGAWSNPDAAQSATAPAIDDRVPHSKRLLRFRAVYFDANSWLLRADAVPLLDDNARIARENQQGRLLIIQGNAAIDEMDIRALAQKRAESVRVALIEKGVAEAHIRIENAGDVDPVAPNLTEGGRVQNRRVEFVSIVESPVPGSLDDPDNAEVPLDDAILESGVLLLLVIQDGEDGPHPYPVSRGA